MTATAPPPASTADRSAAGRAARRRRRRRREGAIVRSAWSSSPCTCSTTTSSSRSPARRPATTSSAASCRWPLLGARRRGLSAAARRPARRAGARARPARHRRRASRRCHSRATVGPSGDDFTGLLAHPRRARADRPRRRHAVADAADRRATCVALPAPRRCSAVAASSWRSPWSCPVGLAYVTTHVGRAVVPANRARRPVREREVHDQRRPRAARLVHPVAQRRRGDRVPGPQRARSARRGCSPATATACCCSTGAARARARATRTRGAGAATQDIEAAIAFLQRRPDVDPGRIGGIGLSVGGEMMLEAAAGDDELAAVVSEGAGARSMAEDLDQAMPGARQGRRRSARRAQDRGVAVFANQIAAARPRGARCGASRRARSS